MYWEVRIGESWSNCPLLWEQVLSLLSESQTSPLTKLVLHPDKLHKGFSTCLHRERGFIFSKISSLVELSRAL